MYVTKFCAQDMHQQSSDDDLISVVQLPYFDGDFWPKVIEEQIKEIDQKVQVDTSGEVCQSILHVYIRVIVVRD